jgi:hypothetical protein
MWRISARSAGLWQVVHRAKADADQLRLPADRKVVRAVDNFSCAQHARLAERTF